MKVLLCVDNNLQNDTREKRHIMKLVEQGNTVHVLCRPNPSEEFGMDVKGVSHTFFDFDHMPHPITPQLRKMAQEWGILNELERSCPVILSDKYFDEKEIVRYSDIISKRVEGGRWADIRKRISEEMSSADAMSFLITFLESSMLMAQVAESIQADVIICIDIDTLLCGVIHKKKYHSRLIYDIQDVTCDISPGLFPQIYSNMLMMYEKQFVQYADAVISVGNHLLKWAQVRYGITVPCVPIYSCSQKEYLEGIEPKQYYDERLRIYYHGLIFEARKIDNIIKALAQVDEIELVLRTGDSEYTDEIRRLIEKLELTDRVKFLEMVPTESVLKAANQDGDIGIYVSNVENCVNWASSFTNKFVEYLGAALPVITTNAEDQARIVREHQCGYVLKDESVESIVQVFEEIKKNKSALEQMSVNSWRVAREVLDWNIYSSLFYGTVVGEQAIIEQGKMAPLTDKEQKQLGEWEKEDIINLRKTSLKRKRFIKKVKDKMLHFIYREGKKQVLFDISIAAFIYIVINAINELNIVQKANFMVIGMTRIAMLFSAILVIRGMVIILLRILGILLKFTGMLTMNEERGT